MLNIVIWGVVGLIVLAILGFGMFVWFINHGIKD